MSRILSGFSDAAMWEERDGRIVRRNASNTYVGALLSGFTIEEWIERTEVERRASDEKTVSERGFRAFLTHWGSKKATPTSPCRCCSIRPTFMEFFTPQPPRLCERCGMVDDEEEEHDCISPEEKQWAEDAASWYSDVNGWKHEETDLVDQYDGPIQLKARKKRTRHSQAKCKKFEPKAQKRGLNRGDVRVGDIPSQPLSFCPWEDELLDEENRIYDTYLVNDVYHSIYNFTDTKSIIFRFRNLMDEISTPSAFHIRREWERNKDTILADYKPIVYNTTFQRYFMYNFDEDLENDWDYQSLQMNWYE